jgi:hypothetical protein
VLFEDDVEPEEQPQLYDGVLLEVDADGDIIFQDDTKYPGHNP